MIYRGTTQELIFDLSTFDLSELININIYFQQESHSWLFDSITLLHGEPQSFENKSEIDFSTRELKLFLTETDTSGLKPAVDLHIQLKITLGNKIIATEYFTEYIYESLSEGVVDG